MSWNEVGLKRMLTDWLFDPVRRRHVVVKCLESAVGIAVAYLTAGVTTEVLSANAVTLTGQYVAQFVGMLVGVPCGVLGDFLFYEFVSERYLGAGPYWERGPADGETFIKW